MEGKDQASFQVRPAPLFHIFPSLIPSPVVGSNPALVFSAYGAELPPPTPDPHFGLKPRPSVSQRIRFAHAWKPSL